MLREQQVAPEGFAGECEVLIRISEDLRVKQACLYLLQWILSAELK
jgi:hypothetical protein